MADETLPPATLSAGSRIAPMAIVGLVLAILSCALFLSFPISLALGIGAVVCGYIARSKIRRSGGALRGKGIALGALVVGYVGLAVALVFTVLAGTMVVDMIRSDRARLHDLAVEKKEIASEDGKLKLTTSGFWVKTSDLNKDAVLQVQNKSQDMYVMVFRDPKSAVGPLNLEQRHQSTRDRKVQTMENGSATQPVSLTIDGRPALQDEVSGRQKGINLVFLHTTVDEGDNFQQIIAWTTKSRWPKQNQELRDITGSFHIEK